MEDTPRETAKSLYETDFYGWTQEQAALLRAGRLDAADVPNIVEEIETLGRSEFSALRSAYRLIALHLLKIAYQPSHRTESWTATVVRERNTLVEVLDDNPGLRPRRLEALAKAYGAARREAKAETHLPLHIFPADCPFTLEEIESHDFWPEPGEA